MNRQVVDQLSRQCIKDIPLPSSSWNDVMLFLGLYSQEIDGYGYGDALGGYEAFLIESIEMFDRDGYLPNKPHPLLAILYLLFRRHYCTGGYCPPVEVEYKRLISAILTKATQLANP